MGTEIQLLPEIQPIADGFPRFDWSDIAGVRRQVGILLEEAEAAQPISSSVSSEDTDVPRASGDGGTVQVRIYRRAAGSARGAALPALIWMHGSGFAVGGLSMSDLRCATYVEGFDCVIVSVDYRLAPENPFPCGFDDCFDVVSWVVENAPELGIDRSRVGVGGDSAGGALAAGVAQKARDLELEPRLGFQLLAYPVLDNRCETASMRSFSATPIWDSVSNGHMWTYYLGPDREDAPLYAAPGLTPELSGLPPTYLLVCEYDPLRDEGLDYGRRLVDSNVPTEIHHWPGTLHAFDQFALASGLPLGQRAIGEQIEALARGLALD